MGALALDGGKVLVHTINLVLVNGTWWDDRGKSWRSLGMGGFPFALLDTMFCLLCDTSGNGRAQFLSRQWWERSTMRARRAARISHAISVKASVSVPILEITFLRSLFTREILHDLRLAVSTARSGRMFSQVSRQMSSQVATFCHCALSQLLSSQVVPFAPTAQNLLMSSQVVY